MLVFCFQCMSDLCSAMHVQFFFSDLDVHVSESVPIKIFSMSFESTLSEQQYGTNITFTKVRGKSYGE